MKGIIDKYLTAKEITESWQLEVDNGTIPVYPLEQFFPHKVQAGTRISYIKGTRGKSVLLRASTYEDQATLRGRLNATMKEEEMPYFKEGLPLYPHELQELAKIQNLANDHPIMVRTINSLYDDRIELIKGSYGRAEWLRAQVLQGENIAIDDNGVVQVIDYGLEAEQVETLVGDFLWDGATPAILNDLKSHKAICRAREGITPNLMMINSTTFAVVVNDTGVQNAVKQTVANGSDLVFITEEMVKGMLKSVLGLTILINDSMYQETVGGAKIKYIADGKVILFNSEVKPGSTVFGTTPESILPPEEGQVENIDGEISILTDWDKNPVTKLTIASMVCLPSGEGLNTIQVLNTL